MKDFARYKALINADIVEHSQLLLERWQRDYGLETAQMFDAYLSVLSRGGKRLRGILGIWAYEQAGGNDEELAVRAGRLLEMVHAYLLVVDDIADEANLRRGDLSAHKLIEKHHAQQGWMGNASHFGEAQAMNAGLAAQHIIMQEMAELPVGDSVKLEALRELSSALTRTVAGQIADINFQVMPEASEREVLAMMRHKTAYYSFVNPLQIGVILAGGDWAKFQYLETWAVNIGLSFQLQDDILGVFGSDDQTGKSNLDDLKEGKRTLLVVRALASASPEQKQTLLATLGNPSIGQPELESVQAIFEDTGALHYVRELSERYASKAIEALVGQNDIEFLEILSKQLLRRQS